MADGLIIEPVISSPTLYLFGAGHVSQFVSKIAALADFDVTVIDDRGEFANRERFPEAQEVIVETSRVSSTGFNSVAGSTSPYLRAAISMTPLCWKRQ